MPHENTASASPAGPARLVVLISGTGSNLAAVLAAIEQRTLTGAQVVAVIADVDAAGLDHARSRSIPTAVVRLADHEDRAAWDRALADEVASHAPDLIVLAGFMRLLGAPMLERFGGRIINTHPALLPSFPGAHGVRDALAYGVKVTGATVIEVDAGIDTGRILDQRPVLIEPGDTEDTLHERIKEVERVMIVDVIRDLLQAAPVGPPTTTLAPSKQTGTQQK